MKPLTILPIFNERHQRPRRDRARRKALVGEQLPFECRKEALGDRVDVPLSVKQALAPLRRWAATA